MIESLINPADPPERRQEKLLEIIRVLMRRVEQITDDGGAAYAQFQRAALLEDQVRERTRDLISTLDLLNASNAALEEAHRETERARQNLANAIETVQEGFALFDPGDVLVMCNSRFGMHMADIRHALRPGLRFAAYVGLVSRSPRLALPAGETPEAWAVARMRRHAERHVIFNVALTGDHWMQVSEHRTADGGTVILQTDVTDLIRMERREMGRILDDQERLLRATLDHISQGVAIFDKAARLVGWNQRLGALLAIPAALLRLGAGFEAILQHFGTGFRMGEGMTAARLRDWAGDTARPALSFELVQPGGPILAVHAQEMPDRGFVMSFTDITAERVALAGLSAAKDTLEVRVVERTLDLEDALGRAERANASRTRFVAAASHDLLQPLSAAKLFLSSIPEETVAPDVAQTLGKAQNALMSVEAILAALLDISKLESGKVAVTVAPLRLDRLMAQLAEEFAPMAAAKGLRLRVRLSDALVMSDAGYLRRILQNLIGNAIRYTERGGVLVTARMRRGGRGLRLEVWDSGPGIPEEEQDNIFKEFHRIAARASASEGLGLGLAIVERACALLGHPLALWSRMGRGTVFMLEVPLAEAAPEAAPPLAPPPRPAEIAGRIVLLVENDADLRRALVLVMERWGAEVIEAASAAEAMALIADLGILPDALVVDHQLDAGETGLDLIGRLAARAGPLPARLITASRDPALRQSAAEAGVVVMEKPVAPAALRAFLAGLPPAAPAPPAAPTTKGP